VGRSQRQRRYPSDMSDAEWAVCEPLLPTYIYWAMIVMTRRLARKPVASRTLPNPQVT